MNYFNALLALSGVLMLSMISPGPNFVIVTSTAVTSPRAGLATGLGLAAASGTWACIAIAGVSVIVAHVAWVGTVLRLAGACYLVWLGAKMLLTARQPLQVNAQADGSGWRAAKKGYVVSMTNPKTIAFYGSIFAVVVPVGAPDWLNIAVVVLTVVLSCLWYCSMALLASHPAVREFLVRRKAALDSVVGVVLIGLGGRMLVGR